MKTLSKASVYGLRALAYVAAKNEGPAYVSIREISEELDISFHFLTKTFQQLTRAGVLVSYRGPSGGIALAKPADQIFLIDIVKVIEGEDFFLTCLLGLPGCGETTPCPLHDFWARIRTEMQREFAATSLAELGEKVSERHLRIKS